MTNHVVRLYALALALLVFFLTWSVVAARPWATATAKADPRIAALAAREQRVRAESVAVRRLVRRRWAVYRARLHQRESQIAAARAEIAAAQTQIAAPPAPSVQVVTLPPLTVTRTS